MHIWFPTVRANSGADRYVETLAEGLTKLGQATTITWFSSFYELFPTMMARTATPTNVDIIHTNSWSSFSSGTVPVVTTVHNCVHDPIFAPYRSKLQKAYHDLVVKPHETNAFQQAIKTIAVSRYTAKIVREMFPGVQPEVIMNGVDTEFFTPQPQGGHASSGPFRLLFVGKGSRRKGVDLLPAIMRKLGKDYVLYVAGEQRDNELKRTPNVYSLGQLSQGMLRDKYRRSDALLFPTRYEGFGYGVCEAMACGIPAIITDIAALPEVVENGESGLLCPLDDVDAFVAAVRRLQGNPDYRMQLGATARRRVEQRFTLGRVAREYTDLYESICQISIG